MSHPRKLEGSPDELDLVLQQLPLPVAEPTSAEWELQFSRTLQRIEARPRSTRPRDVAVATSDSARLLNDVLLAPLPLESEELGLGQAPLGSGDLGLAQAALPLSAATRQSAELGRGTVARRRPWYLVGAFGTLAAAAAATLWFRQAAPAGVAAVSASDVQSATVTAPIVAARPATPTDEVTSPRTEDLPLSPANAKSLPNAVAARAQAKASASRPTHLSRALPEAEIPEEPALTPAAGPSSLNDHPANGEVFSALSKRMPSARQCLTPTAQSTSVRVTFQSSGTVQRIDVLNSAIAPAASNCLKKALAEAQVAPFARSQFEVTTTVSP